MKKFKLILTAFVVCMSFIACNNGNKEISDELVIYQCPMNCEGDKTYSEAGSCPVCKMDLKILDNDHSKEMTITEISDESIFNLTSKWQSEEGETIVLEDLKGKTLVMVMIYTTCKAACPRLVADMRNIEAKIPEESLRELRFVLVSIDPTTDTPKRLKTFAIENFMDAEHWTFLQGTEAGVREFANVLAIKYKQISPMDFSHSNIISVFNDRGEMVHQQEGLGIDNKSTVAKILELTN